MSIRYVDAAERTGLQTRSSAPIELREVSGATNACLFYHAAPKSAPFSGSGQAGAEREVSIPKLVRIARKDLRDATSP
jgi:hypothetical protein